MTTAPVIRLARPGDIPALRELIEDSVRSLQAADYSAAQLDAALGTVLGVDSRLIADGTYFVVEADERWAACGGWSRRRTLFGSDAAAGRADDLLDPALDAAKIRAFFVHPDFARRGIGTLLLEACEQAARGEGFRRFELGATLTGVRLFGARGYVEQDRVEVALPAGGGTYTVVRMEKAAPSPSE